MKCCCHNCYFFLLSFTSFLLTQRNSKCFCHLLYYGSVLLFPMRSFSLLFPQLVCDAMCEHLCFFFHSFLFCLFILHIFIYVFAKVYLIFHPSTVLSPFFLPFLLGLQVNYWFYRIDLWSCCAISKCVRLFFLDVQLRLNNP